MTFSKPLNRLWLAITGICLFATLYGQSSRGNRDILFWTKSHRLSFSDFQGSATKRDMALEETAAPSPTHRLGSISKSINVHFETGRGKTVFTIQAAMLKGSSWIKHPGDSISLKHEQGHFDICEIYARILRRDIRKSKSLVEAKRMFANVTAAEELEHDTFDRENTYGLGGITHDWRTKIAARLKRLEAYSNPVVIVAIGK